MLFHSGTLQGLACPICNIRGHVCGDSHMRGDPIDSRRGVDEVMAEEKTELAEYEYYVGNIPHTAMLTPKMAKRLSAKPVGEASADDVPSGGNTGSQRQAQLGTTEMRNATDVGTEGGTTPYRGAGSDREKARQQAKNKTQ